MGPSAAIKSTEIARARLGNQKLENRMQSKPVVPSERKEGQLGGRGQKWEGRGDPHTVYAPKSAADFG